MQLPTLTAISVGLGAGVGAAIDANFDTCEANAQLLQDQFEAAMTAIHGTGVLEGSYAGALVTVGAGLNATTPALVALIGAVATVAAATVPLSANVTNHIWLRQTGVYETNTSGTNPGTLANPATKIGRATTNAVSVTAVLDEAYLVRVNTALRMPVMQEFTAGNGGAWDAAEDGTGGTDSHYAFTVAAVDATRVQKVWHNGLLLPAAAWTHPTSTTYLITSGWRAPTGTADWYQIETTPA